jgi:hypothetical protein
MIGLEELVIPDEESRTKQYREIAQLLAEVPVASSPVGQASACHAPNAESSTVSPFGGTGTPACAPLQSAQHDRAIDAATVLPTIMPDEFADNHSVELAACMRWFSSDAGQVAKIEAPAGYANVRAHAMLHKSYLLKQQGALLQHPATLLASGPLVPRKP